MGGLPIGPMRVNRRKHPDSWVRAVQPPSLGGSAIVSRSKAWAVTVHLSLTDGLPIEISAKVLNYDLTSANPVASSIFAASLLVFFLVISRCIPSELFDPFGESPSELPMKSHRIV
ncbi:hypothetical protein GW17_00047137 [Ensete ventricosum]|nr:hypothetical protein GW17_00047137 [Ensete ventricosum]